MKKRLLLLVYILPVLAFPSADLDIKPITYSLFNSQGGMWKADKKPIYILGLGGRASLDYKNLNVYAQITNSYYTMRNVPHDFTKSQGVQKPENYFDDSFYLQNSKAKIEYELDNFTFHLGRYNNTWGPGISSIVLSDKVPPFPQFSFNWNINNSLKFKYLHGKLRSSIIDSTGKDRGPLETINVTPEISRYIAAHRLTWRINDNIKLGATEAVVYGERELDLNYAIPVLWYWSAEHYIGDKDNVYMAADIVLNPINNLELYGTFYMDEWKPEATFSEDNHNQFAYKAGLKYSDIYLSDDKFRLEYIWTDHRIYRNRDPVDYFYSYNYPLGFWAGPHSEELFTDYSFNWRKMDVNLSYSFAKRGELTDEMLIDQYGDNTYKRYSGKTESRKIYNIKIDRKLWKNLNVHLGISRIIWNNANFDPFNPDRSKLKDVTKNNITLGILYNIDPDIFTEL